MRILSKAGAACGLLCSWIGTPAQAQSWESLPALEQLLHQFLGKEIREIEYVDEGAILGILHEANAEGQLLKERMELFRAGRSGIPRQG